MSETDNLSPNQAENPIPEQGTETSPNPLCGVKGWLKFFVIINLYVAPILFVLRSIASWGNFFMIIEDYPRIILVGLIETGVGAFLIWKWMQIARHLRDISAGVVQEAKKWLLIVLAWNILSTPISFMSGLDIDILLISSVKVIIKSLIGFAIWYSYFTVSKRVKATYPDWDQKQEQDSIEPS